MDKLIKELYKDFKEEIKDENGEKRELVYFINVDNIDPERLFVADKVMSFLSSNQGTAAVTAIEDYIYKKLSQYSTEIGQRRFTVYKQIILTSLIDGKIQRMWLGVPFEFVRDFWEVFFLIVMDINILQQLAMQK